MLWDWGALRAGVLGPNAPPKSAAINTLPFCAGQARVAPLEQLPKEGPQGVRAACQWSRQ